MPVLSVIDKKIIHSSLLDFLNADEPTADHTIINFMQNYFLFYNFDAAYDANFIHKSLYELLRGFRQFLGFAFLQWVEGEASWHLNVEKFAYFKTLIAIANVLKPRGYTGAEIVIIDSPQLKKPYQTINMDYDENENMIFTHTFLNSYYHVWNGEAELLHEFDTKTQIIIPVSTAEASFEKVKAYAKNISRNYMNFFSADKQLGLNASNINIFFGIFLGADSRLQILDARASAALKVREDGILAHINIPGIKAVYHSEFKKTEYYELATKVVARLLYQHFDELKFLLASDLVTYLRLQGRDAFVREIAPIAIADLVLNMDYLELHGTSNLAITERMQIAVLQRVKNIPHDKYGLAQMYAKFIMYYLANQGKLHPDKKFAGKIWSCLNEIKKCAQFGPEKRKKVVRNFTLFKKKYCDLVPVSQVKQNTIPYGKSQSMFDSMTTRGRPVVKITSDLADFTEFLTQNLNAPALTPLRHS
jgi:hypothetical protein